MNIITLLSSSNYIPLNKSLIKELGLEEAIIFSELCSELEYWKIKGGLDSDGFFYSTIENMEDKTTLSGHKQRKALKKLQELSIVEVKLCGAPPKRYVKINEDSIVKIFNSQKLKNLTFKSEKIEVSNVKKFNGNNNITNKNIINKNIKEIKESKKEKSSYDDILDTVSNEELKNSIREFIKMRKLIKKPLTNKALELAIKKLDRLADNDDDKIQIVNNAVMNSWQSFYPLKKEETKAEQDAQDVYAMFRDYHAL